MVRRLGGGRIFAQQVSSFVNVVDLAEGLTKPRNEASRSEKGCPNEPRSTGFGAIHRRLRMWVVEGISGRRYPHILSTQATKCTLNLRSSEQA